MRGNNGTPVLIWGRAVARVLLAISLIIIGSPVCTTNTSAGIIVIVTFSDPTG
jgi:hypothetical protein